MFQVCQSWKKLGIRMNLSCYIGYIQSQEKSNSASLRMLLRLWSSAKPESYNVKNLKRVLAAEVRIEIEKHIQQNLMVECDVMNDITLYLVGTKYIIAK